MIVSYGISDFFILMIGCVLMAVVPGMSAVLPSGEMKVFTLLVLIFGLAFLKNCFLHVIENTNFTAGIVFSIADAVRLVPLTILMKTGLAKMLVQHSGMGISVSGILWSVASAFLMLLCFDMGEIVSGMLVEGKPLIGTEGFMSRHYVDPTIKAPLISLGVSMVCGGVCVALMCLL